MTVSCELQRVYERKGLRGLANLRCKESRYWWGTHRWWINALLWSVLLCGLTAIMLFAPNEGVAQASGEGIAQAGGVIAYTLTLGLSVLFEFGAPMIAIGTVIQALDLIISEKQNGLTAWLLSKPVTRRAYVLAKVAATAPPVLVLLVWLPSTLVYGMLWLRLGAMFPLAPFLSAVGIISIHTIFYLVLTLMLGTVFNSRGPILGIALGSVLGGGILGGFIQPLFYITPWMLPKVAWLAATGQAIPAEMGIASLVATTLWSMVFLFIALVKIGKTEC